MHHIFTAQKFLINMIIGIDVYDTAFNWWAGRGQEIKLSSFKLINGYTNIQMQFRGFGGWYNT